MPSNGTYHIISAKGFLETGSLVTRLFAAAQKCLDLGSEKLKFNNSKILDGVLYLKWQEGTGFLAISPATNDMFYTDAGLVREPGDFSIDFGVAWNLAETLEARIRDIASEDVIDSIAASILKLTKGDNGL